MLEAKFRYVWRYEVSFVGENIILTKGQTIYLLKM